MIGVQDRAVETIACTNRKDPVLELTHTFGLVEMNIERGDLGLHRVLRDE